MKTFLYKKINFSYHTTRLQKIFALFFVILTFFGFTACHKEIRYFDYVSELRSNIFLAESDELLLRIYAVEKETPYVSDGIPKETTARTEIYLVAPSGEKTCTVQFTVNEKQYGGEMSYDSVRAEYYFSCTLNVSNQTEIICNVTYDEFSTQMYAKSVLKEGTLSPQNILKNLQKEERELFTSLTDKYGFAGEIYLRLIYEDSPFYYVGIIDRKGKINAFLLNATTGKILAKRQS